ncbi:12144_t:CDS:1, partial [Ambispora leptoticha]
PVFYDREFGQQLQLQICRNNLRPTIIEGSPQCYINLMKKCWESEPDNRPSSLEIREIFTKWQNDETILLELDKSKDILKNVKDMQMQAYPEVIYTSKFINYTTSLYQ